MAEIARIALPRPVRQLFDYLVPEDSAIKPGQRVRVPFGRQTLVGIVIELDPSDPPQKGLKPIQGILEDWPVVPRDTRKLLLWAARYYQHPPGECIFSALPPALRKGSPASLAQTEYWWPNHETTEQPPSRAHRQKALLQWLRDHPGQSRSAIRAAGFDPSLVLALEKKGLAVRSQSKPAAVMPAPLNTDVTQPLNPAQNKVIDALEGHSRGFATHLLFGITGSGKTEVYIHYLMRRIERAYSPRQYLVLVPEINLTPQTMARFQRYFGARLAVWHSALNASERLQSWSRVREGEPVIVVGTRSAVLLPFTNLDTLVVDEEHDGSYKQTEGFRYSARDLAIYRGWQNQCPVILGSATPSLESLHNARTGRYQLHRLDVRAGDAQLPVMQLVDVRSRPLRGGISPPLLEAVGETLREGEQALLFINRRGFSPVVMCFDCGTPIDCPKCDARLTFHRRDNCLRCHHCGHQQALPRRCGECASESLHAVGQGTERTETVLQEHFPQTPVLRIDRDSTRRRGELDRMLDQVRSGEPCILVGTQMLAKGHDFPAVTLAGVLDADGGLFSSDFRGPEHLAQLLVQVAGRAGRGQRPGRVMVQTCQSGHPLLQQLCHGDYLSVAETLLAERHQAGLPPASFMTAFRMESDDMDTSMALLEELSQRARGADDDIQVMGPFPAIMARKANRFRAQLLLQHTERSRLHRLSHRLCLYLEQRRPGRQVRWSIDVDPLNID